MRLDHLKMLVIDNSQLRRLNHLMMLVIDHSQLMKLNQDVNTWRDCVCTVPEIWTYNQHQSDQPPAHTYPPAHCYMWL